MWRYYRRLLRELPETFRSEWKKWEFWLLAPVVFSSTLAAWFEAYPLPWWPSPLSMLLLFAWLFLRANYAEVRRLEAENVTFGDRNADLKRKLAAKGDEANRVLGRPSQLHASFLSHLAVQGRGMRNAVAAAPPDLDMCKRIQSWRQEVERYLQHNSPDHAPGFAAPMRLGSGEMLVGFPQAQTEWLHLLTILLKRLESIEQLLRTKV